MSSLLTHPFIPALGLALLHALWQGALIGALCWAGLRLLANRRPELRYGVACSALLLQLLALVGTLEWLILGVRVAPATVLPAGLAAVAGVVVEVAASEPAAWSSRLMPLLPWAVLGWLVGVGLMALRLAGGWAWMQRLRHAGAEPASWEWQLRLNALARQLHLHRSVRLLKSKAVAVPTVLGWLKPVVLVPVGAFLALSPEALEAILAHELAHVRRQDYLVNLLQSVVEALLFFHPATWWISRQIRELREHCCDDVAVAHCGDARAYARALAELEALRHAPLPDPHLAIAATGGSLMNRIQRMLTPALPPSPTARAGIFAALAVTLLGAGTTLGLKEPEKKPEARTEKAEAGKKPLTIVVHENDGTQTLRLKGKVKVQPEAKDYLRLEGEGASFSLQETKAGKSRQFTAERQGGKELRRYTVDGKELPLDAEGEAWLRQALKSGKEAEGSRQARHIRIGGEGPSGKRIEVRVDKGPGETEVEIEHEGQPGEHRIEKRIILAAPGGKEGKPGLEKRIVIRKHGEPGKEAEVIELDDDIGLISPIHIPRLHLEVPKVEIGKDGSRTIILNRRSHGPEALKAEMEGLRRAMEGLQRRMEELRQEMAGMEKLTPPPPPPPPPAPPAPPTSPAPPAPAPKAP